MKVTIIITAYNAAEYISHSIESALNQDFPPHRRADPRDQFEVLVIDDGSTDNTLEVLKKFGNSIRVITQENQGFVGAVNTGFREALGEYVVKLDSDDVFEPNLLKEEVAVLDADPNIDFVYCDYHEQVGEKRKVVTTETVFHAIAGGMMFRKEKLAEEGYWKNIQFPEYDLILRTWERWKGARVAKPLMTYIRRADSVTMATSAWQEKALEELHRLHPQRLDKISQIRKY